MTSVVANPLPQSPPPATDADGVRRFRFLTGRARTVFASGYAAAALVAAGVIFFAAAAPGGRDLRTGSSTILGALWIDLALIALLALIAGRRVLMLFGARTRDAGVRLHRRFVILFAIAAVAPAIVVALFFGLLVNRGVESWFSDRVRTVVENSATVARAYLDEQEAATQHGLTPLADDLNRSAAILGRSPFSFGRFLLEELASRDFVAIYVIDRDGRVLARAEQPGAPPYLAPPPEMTAPQHGGDAPLRLQSDMARAVFRLSAYPDAYVYVVRPLGAGIMAQLRDSYRSVKAYRESEASRARIQDIFVLSYVATALLVLLGAVWVGVALAGQIAAPVARLVQAADRVAGGDLAARVPHDGEPEELAVLTRAFNRMTGDLGDQQEALRRASLQAQDERAFIEAVLSGVSAGVLGLDAQGRISAANTRALVLLGLHGETVVGRPLGQAAPELAGALEGGRKSGGDTGVELDVTRGGETRRLRVRASGATGAGAGVVLTFDDVTRLVAAQRAAAWRDVARRIAHEIKNPLTPIQLSAERLRRKYRKEIVSDVETFDRCTDTIIRQVGDIGRMVDEFSSFARMPAPVFAEEDAAEVLRAAVFAQRVAYPDIAVELDDPGRPEPILCDARMLGQALTNVLKNAGESVAARVSADPSRGPGLIRAALDESEGRIDIVIEDDGVGLPARDRERLTEPYVTTREKGTGLGLAIVKRICEEHGGDLCLRDAVRLGGARVELRLPRSSRAGASAEPESRRIHAG